MFWCLTSHATLMKWFLVIVINMLILDDVQYTLDAYMPTNSILKRFTLLDWILCIPFILCAAAWRHSFSIARERARSRPAHCNCALQRAGDLILSAPMVFVVLCALSPGMLAAVGQMEAGARIAAPGIHVAHSRLLGRRQGAFMQHATASRCWWNALGVGSN